jgi:hypothetical protein
MGGSYTCVMCGKSRSVQDYRAEFVKLQAAAKRPHAWVTAPPVPAPAPTFEAHPTPSPPPAPRIRSTPKAKAPVVEAATQTKAACAWKDCDEIPRTASKYCSRRCSNKNARWRHAKRRTA